MFSQLWAKNCELRAKLLYFPQKWILFKSFSGTYPVRCNRISNSMIFFAQSCVIKVFRFLCSCSSQPDFSDNLKIIEILYPIVHSLTKIEHSNLSWGLNNNSLNFYRERIIFHSLQRDTWVDFGAYVDVFEVDIWVLKESKKSKFILLIIIDYIILSFAQIFQIMILDEWMCAQISR